MDYKITPAVLDSPIILNTLELMGPPFHDLKSEKKNQNHFNGLSSTTTNGEKKIQNHFNGLSSTTTHGEKQNENHPFNNPRRKTK